VPDSKRRGVARLAPCAIALLLCGTSRADEKQPRRPVPRPGPALQLEIEAPAPDALVGAADGKLMVSGRALASAVRGGRFDVIAVVDTSSSTHAASGADVDGDGQVGIPRIGALGRLLDLPSTDPGDSVLAAEIAAVRTLLAQLDPHSTRVGVVAFAGDGRDPTPDAHVAVPLSSDYAQVEAALDALLAAGAHGRTNIQAGILLAARELSGGAGAQSEPRPQARKVALLVTDGQPTLPDSTSRRSCARMAVEAAEQAAELGIRIDAFALGRDATDQPWVAVEIARVSSGVFTPVVQPGELVAAFQEVRLADITGVQISNLTTRRPAEQVRLESDGWFGGIVALARGRNRIEIRAYARDGRRIIRVVDARLGEGAPAQELPPRLMARRTRMLEKRLDHTREYTRQLEAQRREKLRAELEKQMREKRSRRSRALDIEGEPTPAAPADR
jgi:Mg-chelatase subunit ChlD